MSTLYLHVGHGKTGSSYIQSSLAKNINVITSQGFYYPFSRDTTAAAMGRISSGNAYEFESYLNSRRIKEKVVFSGENFFHIFRGETGKRLLAEVDSSEFERIEVLLFIRDPIDHAPSSYQQSIKRGGKFWTVEEFFRQYSVPKLVVEIIKNFRESRKINLTVLNYTSCRDRILEEFCAWCGLNDREMTRPVVTNVNRSLTRAEIFFQRELNRILGRNASFFSDSLCNELHNVKSDVILPDLAVQESMLQRMRPYIEWVNKNVDPESRYNIETVAPGHLDKVMSFYPEQIECMARTLAKAIAKNVK